MTASSEPAAPISALSDWGFRLYWASRVLMVLGLQILSVSVGWQIYDITRDPFLLGLVGLVQFMPALVLVLFTGTAADRYNRRRIMGLCMAIEACCALAILYILHQPEPVVRHVYIVLVFMGVARAFMGPAVQSLVANLVPIHLLPNAVAINSSGFQLASIAGPALGGLLYGISSEFAYGTASALLIVACILTFFIPKPAQKSVPEPATMENLLAGFRYIWNQPVMLGALTLDLAAVLLGGATALLPVFARDILDVGPLGLGLLRAASGIGALLMSIWLFRHTINENAGLKMFVSVAVFGMAIIVFGASTTVWISVLALAVMGAADMVSVYIRATLIQLRSPDAVRGRVSAVNMTFIGASNELGEFRAGTMAAAFGAVPAVITGGIGAILVSAIWLRLFPDLKNIQRLDRLD